MITASLIVATVLAFSGHPQQTEEALKEAIYEEVALGKTEQALAAYRKVLARQEASRETQARALHRIAVCLAKMGRPEEAEEAVRSLGERFADAADVHARAKEEVGRYSTPATGRFGRPEIERLILTLGTGNDDARREAGRMLVVLGEESLPSLQEALKHPDEALRLRAAQVLWDMGDASGFEVLLAGLPGRVVHQTLVTGHGTTTLGEMIEADEARLVRITELLESSDDPRMLSGLIGLIRRRDFTGDRIRKRMRDLSVSDDASVRGDAMACILEVAPLDEGLDAALRWLDQRLESPRDSVIDPWYDRACKEEPYPTEMVLRLILKGLDHEDRQVQWLVLHMASRMRDHYARDRWDLRLEPMQVIEVIEKSLTLDDDRVRGGVKELLFRLVSEDIDQASRRALSGRLQALFRTLRARGDSDQQRVGLEGLLGLATEDGNLRREMARDALYRHRSQDELFGRVYSIHEDILLPLAEEDPDFLPDLMESMVADADTDLPHDFIDSVEAYGGDRREEILQSLLQHRPGFRYTLARHLYTQGDPGALPLVLQLLDEGSKGEQVKALGMLKSIGDIDTVPRIIPLLDERDMEIRDAARDALTEIRRLDEEKDQWHSWYEERKAAEKGKDE